LLYEAGSFESLDVVVGRALWNVEFVDKRRDRDRSVLQNVGIDASQGRRFEEIDDCLELLEWRPI
jgi:hypothetical protein